MSFYLLIQKNFVPLHSLLKRSVRDLAQLVAHTSGGREVAGSSPVIPTERVAKRLIISCLATFLFRNSRDIPVVMVVRAHKG